MSQHDMNIQNQGFPAFRADLNDALSALASNSAGIASPSTPYAYQFWYETDLNLLRMRNADNDAWITLAYFDQTNDEWEVRSAVIQAVDSAGVVIKTDDGTARITVNDNGTVDFANDIDVTGTVSAECGSNLITDNAFDIEPNGGGSSQGGIGAVAGGVVGINGNNQVQINTVSTRRFRIDQNGDISIYEDTGTTPKLFWDASEEHLGIGTTSDFGGVLNVAGRIVAESDDGLAMRLTSTQNDANTGPNVYLYSDSSSPADNDLVGGITWRFNDSNGAEQSGTQLLSKLLDVTAGTTDTGFTLYDKVAGSDSNILTKTLGEIIFNQDSRDLDFRIESDINANTFKIDSGSGGIIIGAASMPGTSNSGGAGFDDVTNDRNILKLGHDADNSTKRAMVVFYYKTSAVGQIESSNSSTNYSTTSDYRLKENVVDLTGAIDRLKNLSPRRFNFIVSPDLTVDGFLAHEAETVVPEAVTGTYNEVDENGNPVYQGIDQGKLVPLLTAALQEAVAKIESLETTQADLLARIEALEAN